MKMNEKIILMKCGYEEREDMIIWICRYIHKIIDSLNYKHEIISVNSIENSCSVLEICLKYACLETYTLKELRQMKLNLSNQLLSIQKVHLDNVDKLIARYRHIITQFDKLVAI